MPGVCGARYQEGGPMQQGQQCIAGCGRFAVGVCTRCSQPVCGICSPDDGPLLCTEHRAELVRKRSEERQAAERAAAATPEARRRRAQNLAMQQYARFKEEWKQHYQERSAGWFENTTRLLRDSLPKLHVQAQDRLIPVRVERSWGRSTSTSGWMVTTGRHLLCVDGLVREPQGIFVDGTASVVGKWKNPIYLDRPVSQQGAFGSVESHVDFCNTRAISWNLRELLGEGPWHEHVLADKGRLTGWP